MRSRSATSSAVGSASSGSQASSARTASWTGSGGREWAALRSTTVADLLPPVLAVVGGHARGGGGGVGTGAATWRPKQHRYVLRRGLVNDAQDVDDAGVRLAQRRGHSG